MSRSKAEELAERITGYLSLDARSRKPADYLDCDIKGLELIRDPSDQDLPANELRTTLQFWRSIPKTGGIPDRVKVAPEEVRVALGYLMLIDIDPDGDFRYALYGTAIAAVAGFDMTGKSVWDIATTSTIQTFFAACYIVVRKMKCPLYTVHEAPQHITASHWHRLILPLGLDGVVKRFLVCNVPILRYGDR